MAQVSESLRAPILPPAAIRNIQANAVIPAVASPGVSFDLTPAQELLATSLQFPFHHASGAYSIKLNYGELIRRFNGVVRIPSPCCLDLLQDRATRIETHIEGRTRCRALLRHKEGLPHILAPLMDALIEAHYNQLEFALYKSHTHFKPLTGFRQVVEELRKNPKGYQLKKIVVQGSIPWLKGCALVKQSLCQLRAALIPYQKRAPTEKELQELACDFLFPQAVPDMFRFILDHAAALEVVKPCFRLVPKNEHKEELCDGYEIHCVDSSNRKHRLTLFDGFAPPPKAHFQELALEFNAKGQFEVHASQEAQKDIRENCLRWIDLKNPSPDDWALHQAFQILGKRAASDLEEQCLLERMARASEKEGGFGAFLSRSLLQATRDFEMDRDQVSAFVFNALLALPAWLLKRQELWEEGNLVMPKFLVGNNQKGRVRLEVLRCILPLCLWSHPEALFVPHGAGFKIWMLQEGHPLLLKFSPAEALLDLARLQPLLPEEEQVVQQHRSKLLAKGPSILMASARREAAELVGHADPYVKMFAKEIFFAGLDATSEAFFVLLQVLPDLLDGEKDPEERERITHQAMERMLVYLGPKFPLLKAAAFSRCLSHISEVPLSRAQMAQLLSRSLSLMGDPVLGNVALQCHRTKEEVLPASQIVPNGLQDIVIRNTSVKKLEDVLAFIQELNHFVTSDSAQEDAILLDWIDKAACYAAPFLQGSQVLQEELFKLYRSARGTIFKRQEPLKLVSQLISLATSEAIELAVEIAKERLTWQLPANCGDPYASLIEQLCKREEDAAYVTAAQFFGDPAVVQRLSPRRREELEALLVATRLDILSKDALNPAALLEVKRFLATSRPVELRKICLKAAMHYLARFFALPDEQLQPFQQAWEGIKELEGEGFLLKASRKEPTDNSWISRWLKSEESQQPSFEISPSLFFRFFFAGFLTFIGERYCTNLKMQESAQGIVNRGRTQIEERFGDLKIEAQDAEDYAYAIQVLLEAVLKVKPERIEIQAVALGVVFFSLKTVLERQCGIEAQRILSGVNAYAFWPMVTFPFLVNLHEHYLKTIVQRADERRLFRNAPPLLRFQLHFVSGEPLSPVPVLPKQRFPIEVSALIDRLRERKCHSEQLRQFQVLLRLSREFGQEYTFKEVYPAFFEEMAQEPGWGRVKLLRLLCRSAIDQAGERGRAMDPVMEMAVPYLLDHWLSILTEHPRPPPEDHDDLLDCVRSYSDELIDVWKGNRPKVVAERYRALFFALMDRRKSAIDAENSGMAPARMIAFCRKFSREYEKWSSARKIKQTQERMAEEWVYVCRKVRAHLDSRSFELTSHEEKQNVLQKYVDLVEVGIKLLPSGGEAYRSAVEGIFEAIEMKQLYPMMNKEEIFHLFLLLAQPTGKSAKLTKEEEEARALCVKKWIRRMQALNVESIDLACRNLLESLLANDIFKQHSEIFAELKNH